MLWISKVKINKGLVQGPIFKKLSVHISAPEFLLTKQFLNLISNAMIFKQTTFIHSFTLSPVRDSVAIYDIICMTEIPALFDHAD